MSDLDSDIRSKIVDITEMPEMTMMRLMLMEETAPGHVCRSFIFKEDSTFSGIFDLDFIYDKLVNVRIQLFAEGFFSSTKMNKKYDDVLDFVKKKFGEGVDDKEFNRLIWNSGDWIITLRKPPKVSGTNPNISFTITDKQFAGPIPGTAEGGEKISSPQNPSNSKSLHTFHLVWGFIGTLIGYFIVSYFNNSLFAFIIGMVIVGFSFHNIIIGFVAPNRYLFLLRIFKKIGLKKIKFMWVELSNGLILFNIGSISELHLF